MTKFEIIKIEMTKALQTKINYVNYSNHMMYNAFVDCDLDKTITMIHCKYLPIGFCHSPAYDPERGVAFVFEDMATFEQNWVHVPHDIFQEWLNTIGGPQ
jgi:hypothetical protein